MKPPCDEAAAIGAAGSDDDDRLLQLAAAGDAGKLAALRERVNAGEPAAYVAGFLEFRGRRFAIDPRAYITDPELTHLIDLVAEEGRRLEEHLGRPPSLLEFGVGAGVLAITVKLEHPHWRVSGLDIDPAALAVARENARSHGVSVALLESDYFSAWDPASPPDLIFGDPPWGGPEDLYTDQRGAGYYRRMPAKSAFPPGGDRCGIHRELIARVRALRWTSRLVLNYGVLPPEVIADSAAPLSSYQVIHPQPHLSVVVGNAVSAQSGRD
jgi:methylase of polypeptide subunit release factors